VVEQEAGELRRNRTYEMATHGSLGRERTSSRSGGVVIVHNGIIENYLPLKKKLADKGYTFESDTDTEVLCHLIRTSPKRFRWRMRSGGAERGERAYAIAVVSEKEPTRLSVSGKTVHRCRLGDDEYFLASDCRILQYSRDVMFLDDGEMVVLSSDGVLVTDLEGTPVQKEVKAITWSPSMRKRVGTVISCSRKYLNSPCSRDTLRAGFLSRTAG